MMYGNHVIKSWATTQSVIALSSGEAEYYGIVKAASQGLGFKSTLEELGILVDLEIKTDSSAALGISRRRGFGKVRHIEVCQLWVQDPVFKGRIKIHKIPGDQNLADHLTKHVDHQTLMKQIRNSEQFVSTS